ncbi:hypothetical protein [Corallococcus sp. EGB]|uniref:hypothetical protein n=1 Tax=Corallococcus sp. EGB TaxID=1521117 RepID=UPI001CBEC7BB|nr:hypothetical protein [Corallococcus sp. EGB]
MTPLSPGVVTAMEQDTSAAPGTLRFRRLWLFSPRADLAILGIPLTLTLVAAFASAFLAPASENTAHKLLGWTAQNILGNSTHVILTFLLFGVHRDVLTATPRQPHTILAGVLAMLGVGAALFFTFYANRSIHTFAVAVIFNVFGMHHTLSQHRGLWSLHGLRGGQEGLAPPSALERKLQQLYVPLLLTVLLIRIFFVAESAAPGAPAYLDVGQGTVLPWQTLPLLIAVWLGYFLLLFRAVLRSGIASGPKVLYLLGMATATGLALVAPSWGYVMLPGMHGLEYYLLSARMLEPREGDRPRLSQKLIWPAMVASMVPLFALGVVHGFLLDGPMRGSLGIGGGAQAHPLLRALTSLGFACVLAHYFADAFIFRFRIPSIRQVMLRRLGFTSAARPAP